MEHDKLLVEAARDHFKSSFFSFTYPLYLVQKIKPPKEPVGIALFSYSEDQSSHNLKRIRETIETNLYLKWLKPKQKYKVWDSRTLDLSNSCWIESYGFGSTFRGRHPKYIIVDDPCKDHGTMSIEQQIQFFSGVLVPALKSKGQGQMIVTGNPVDKIDFLEWLEKNKAFEKRFYPVMDERGRPLAEDHYDIQAIEDKKSMIPAHIFAREYMLKRVSSEDSRFKEEWIQYYDAGEIQGKTLYKVMTIDPALKPGGDALGCVVSGMDAYGNVYILDRMGWRGDLKQGISKLVDLMIEHRPDYIGVETFAFQKMYQVWLEEEILARDIYFAVNELGRDSKKSKSARIESLQPKLAQRKMFFRPEHKPLVDQLLLWDPLSEHNDDDEIDALAYSVPLWTTPHDDKPAEPEGPKAGTFMAELEEMRSASDKGYLSKLFQDFTA